MSRPLCAALSLLSLMAVGAEPLIAEDAALVTATDRTVVPGKRVGPITAYSSLAVLKSLYGARNVIPKMQPLPSGDTTPGARLFAGTSRQLEIVWDEDGPDKRVAEVRIVGSDWAFENGLKTGLPLAEAEKIIGKPIKITGPDGNGGAIAPVESAVPGAAFSLGFAVAPVEEHKHSPSNGKKPGSAEPVRAGRDAVITKIVIVFR